MALSAEWTEPEGERPAAVLAQAANRTRPMSGVPLAIFRGYSLDTVRMRRDFLDAIGKMHPLV